MPEDACQHFDRDLAVPRDSTMDYLTEVLIAGEYDQRPDPLFRHLENAFHYDVNWGVLFSGWKSPQECLYVAHLQDRADFIAEHHDYDNGRGRCYAAYRPTGENEAEAGRNFLSQPQGSDADQDPKGISTLKKNIHPQKDIAVYQYIDYILPSNG
jgi:hypothetical protein